VRHHRQEHGVKGGFKMVFAQKKTDFQGNNYLQLSTITIYNHLQLPYNRYTINGWAQAFRVTGVFMGLVPLPGLIQRPATISSTFICGRTAKQSGNGK
jgi:hypothetical protein